MFRIADFLNQQKNDLGQPSQNERVTDLFVKNKVYFIVTVFIKTYVFKHIFAETAKQ